MVIALLTDFGLEDGFVGTVKGVIKSINSKVDIIDISHNVSSFDVLEGALILKSSYKYFPKKTVFCIVIDPQVGTNRNAIIVKTENYTFVAPDNGVLSLCLEEEKVEEIIKITNTAYTLPRDNNTFHGRDIFAPVSAYLSKGIRLEEFGERIKTINKIELPQPRFLREKIQGQIIKFDKFGNAITNIKNIPSFKYAVINGYKIKKLANSFMEGNKDSLNLIKGSFGFYEVFVPMSSAKDKFKLKKQDEIIIYT